MRYFKAVAHRETLIAVEDSYPDNQVHGKVIDDLFNDLDWSEEYDYFEISKEEFEGGV